jgi:RND superfamily putative drug exporter
VAGGPGRDVAATRAAGTNFSTKLQLPDTQSAQALSLLQKDFPAASGSSDQIVLHATSGTLRDPAVTARAQRMLGQVAALPHVRGVASPFTPAGAGQVSKDGTVAFATVIFDQRRRVPARAQPERQGRHR